MAFSYNFKKIQVIPSGSDFIDIVLSKTQRKTPTVVHKHYQINRIRQFYMRKVKFCQQSFHDRLTQILEDFPLLNDIHPFYSDLMNVLYDKDHYKLALGQINTAKSLIDNLGKDYIRLLKYGDSLYRCKQLKRAAMGRMCTILKKQSESLGYLEQVRQHMARLPSIDPNTRTLLLCGYPNVGKSSFMNKLTRADVEVQPYAFTTKSLFVGHCDHKYLRWQVIDTPGILDHPLEERNTIEMLSITALAHLRASVIFILDISEQCGYALEIQLKLFENIKPLFIGKPLIIGLNKIDVMNPENIRENIKKALMQLKAEGVHIIPMSTFTEVGVSDVKETACEKLLAQRVDEKLGKLKRDDVLSKLNVAMPKPRDTKIRAPNIPISVLQKRQLVSMEATNINNNNNKNKNNNNNNKEEEEEEEEDDVLEYKKKKEQEVKERYERWKGNLWLQAEEDPDWDPTLFGPDWREQYDLLYDEWKTDAIPEIMDGMNIADFYDPEIMIKLKALEEEEEERVKKEQQEEAEENEEIEREGLFLTAEDLAELRDWWQTKKLARLEHAIKTGNNKNGRSVPNASLKNNSTKSIEQFETHLTEMGIDPSLASLRLRSESRDRSVKVSKSRKRVREEYLEKEKKEQERIKTPQQEGMRDSQQKRQAIKKERKSKNLRNKMARKGEGDRTILSNKPKHLFSGKRGIGKTDRR